MSKRKLIITIVAVLLVVAALICCIPQYTRIDAVMDAAKIDKNGNLLGYTTVRIQSNRWDFLFFPSFFTLKVYDFDDYKSFTVTRHEAIEVTNFCYVTAGAAYSNKPTDTYPTFNIFSSPELDRWLLWCYQDDVFYLSSANQEDTPESLLEYFSPINGKMATVLPSELIR